MSLRCLREVWAITWGKGAPLTWLHEIENWKDQARPQNVPSLILVGFGLDIYIFRVKNRIYRIFLCPGGSPFLTVNITVKLARLIYLRKRGVGHQGTVLRVSRYLPSWLMRVKDNLPNSWPVTSPSSSRLHLASALSSTVVLCDSTLVSVSFPKQGNLFSFQRVLAVNKDE